MLLQLCWQRTTFSWNIPLMWKQLRFGWTMPGSIPSRSRVDVFLWPCKEKPSRRRQFCAPLQPVVQNFNESPDSRRVLAVRSLNSSTMSHSQRVISLKKCQSTFFLPCWARTLHTMERRRSLWLTAKSCRLFEASEMIKDDAAKGQH